VEQERPTVVANAPRDAFVYVYNRASKWRQRYAGDDVISLRVYLHRSAVEIFPLAENNIKWKGIKGTETFR